MTKQEQERLKKIKWEKAWQKLEADLFAKRLVCGHCNHEQQEVINGTNGSNPYKNCACST